MPNANYYEALLDNANVAAFLHVIRRGETGDTDLGYRVMYNGGGGRLLMTTFSDHPQYSENWSGARDPKTGKLSHAAGAYQFLGTTWKSKQNALSLADFSPNNQDIAAVLDIADHGALEDIKNGNISLAISKLSGEWTSLPPGGIYNLSNCLAYYKLKGGTLNANDAANATTATPITNVTEGGEGIPDLNFQNIDNNIFTSELNNVFGATWGGAFNAQEESGWIGLKQYLLYLTSKYYPQDMVPFIELIPIYTLETASQTFFNNTIVANAKGWMANPETFLDFQLDPNVTSTFEQSQTFVDPNRFDATALRLFNLTTSGGADLTNVDPFKEATDAFNLPNATGKKLQAARGFGYKIFGNLTLQPSIQYEELSKAGGVGLKSLDIEIGSQTQFGLTLVTIKLLDVQGNKFLDINSPWSFVLNSRPGMAGGDFLFRYGWQINIPEPNRTDDEQGKRFWNHPGWQTFSALVGNDSDHGDAIKKFVRDTAAVGDNTLTLTQVNTFKALKTPGYLLDKTTGEFAIDTENKLDRTLYDTLTLITPELNMNSGDGSIECSLSFRTNTGVANCLALLNGPNTATRQLLCSNTVATPVTLLGLMTAFVNDNKTYITGNPVYKGVANSSAGGSLFISDKIQKEPTNNSWLTVIGGAGTDSLIGVDPSSIIVNISNDNYNDLVRAQKNPKETRLLIEWLYGVLDDNNMMMITAGGNGEKTDTSANAISDISGSGNFIIAYDSDKTKTLTASKTTIQQQSIKSLINPVLGANDFIGQRLVIQDDVFAFRFQGSLIENISIDKLQQPTQQLFNAISNFAGSQGETPGGGGTDVNGKIGTTGLDVATSQNSLVTSATKKAILDILYASMLGLKVEAMCHPWLRLTKPVFVKGMGFWDGQYTLTKVTHHLSEDNKFTSTINACRIVDPTGINAADAKAKQAQIDAMNKPGVGKTGKDIIPKNEGSVNFNYGGVF